MAAAIVAPSTTVRADPVDPPPPPLRHVQYTVWTEQPYGNAEIYSRSTTRSSAAAGLSDVAEVPKGLVMTSSV